MTADALAPPAFRWRRFLAVAGPGIVVMLADTDAGSVITAAQSGAQWGYGLLLLQFILIPILYIVQELTVRLGAVTGKGHAELIRRQFGSGWAWLSVATLIVTCLGALLTEFAGLAGAGNLLGVPAPITLALVVAALLAMALMHGYGTVERIAIAVGAFEPSPCSPILAWTRSCPARWRFRSPTPGISCSPPPTSARSSCRGWCSSSSPRSPRRA